MAAKFVGLGRPVDPSINPFFVLPDLGADGDYEAYGIAEVNTVHLPTHGNLPFTLKQLPIGGGGSADYDGQQTIGDVWAPGDENPTDGIDGLVLPPPPGGGTGGWPGGEPGGGLGAGLDLDIDGNFLTKSDMGGDFIRKTLYGPGNSNTGGDFGGTPDGDVPIGADLYYADSRDHADSDATFGGLEDAGGADGGGDITAHGDNDGDYGIQSVGRSGDLYDQDKDDANAGDNAAHDPGTPSGGPSGTQGDADSVGCDYLTLLRYAPKSGLAAASALILAQTILRAIPTLMLGSNTLAESAAKSALDMLGAILEAIGLTDIAAVTIGYVMNRIGIPSGPLDLLYAGDRAADALQPALNSIERQNGIDAYKNLALANGGCLPQTCAEIYAAYADGFYIPMCTDSADGPPSIIGNPHIGQSSPLRVGEQVIPSSTLAIPPHRPLGNEPAPIPNPFHLP